MKFWVIEYCSFVFQCSLFRTGRKVVSPVKVTLTPSKEGTEEPQEKILTLDSEDELPARERPPALWVREPVLNLGFYLRGC